jgi:hypothetical protein
MMRDFNLIAVDALFEEGGHFLYDIFELSECIAEPIKYIVPKGRTSERARFALLEKGVVLIELEESCFYEKALRFCKEQEENAISIFLSSSTFQLLKHSLFSKIFCFFLVVHFLPKRKWLLHTFMLIVLGWLSRGILTYERGVTKELKKNYIPGLRGELVSRIIRDKKEYSKIPNRKARVSVVGGVLGKSRSVGALLECLSNEFYNNIEFRIFVRGASNIKIDTQNQLELSDRFLTQDEYFEIYNCSDFVYTEFPPNYGTRCSGQFLDAVSSATCPISLVSETPVNYKVRFGVGVMFESATELSRILRSIDEKKFKFPEIKKDFFDWHSKENKIAKLQHLQDLCKRY